MTEVEWEHPMEYAVAFEMAIDALKKQIPKKPNFDELGRDKYWLCPSCGEVVLGILKDDPIINEYNHDFCGGCGQAIDWSEGE